MENIRITRMFSVRQCALENAFNEVRVLVVSLQKLIPPIRSERSTIRKTLASCKGAKSFEFPSEFSRSADTISLTLPPLQISLRKFLISLTMASAVGRVCNLISLRDGEQFAGSMAALSRNNASLVFPAANPDILAIGLGFAGCFIIRFEPYL
jgi:hypothetical protein